ncbi:Similar to Venom allergen 5 (Vespula vulgaris) [Cotesia congregata]|uniref:Similar to Venom allergen 5 (Vespula vulgaris) n=1 Tax=Cotesia congregata TaxID=51543 RepID=A0A8J2HKL4_COTCN|nr:Similar to Venom allergen 5 (Vespula vulgaris) [Cotesia congregata]
MSDLTRLYYLLLVANASYLALTKSDNLVENYCHLCTRHTMCRYPFDDVSPNCKNIEHGDLDPEEILSILNQHNLRRNFIASGKEIRGNPGPQPPAKNMMELSWDDELAVLARRWALQCVLSKDECRDVSEYPYHILYSR